MCDSVMELESLVRNCAISKASASIALTALLLSASAPVAADEQAEWAQRYDADARLTVSR